MNFIHCELPESDKELFFGPLEESEIFTAFSSELTMADLVVEMGVFPSIKQARKNGWNNPIPVGFSAHKIGKRRFHILNRFSHVS
jgi:hypothetical protein